MAESVLWLKRVTDPQRNLSRERIRFWNKLPPQPLTSWHSWKNDTCSLLYLFLCNLHPTMRTCTRDLRPHWFVGQNDLDFVPTNTKKKLVPTEFWDLGQNSKKLYWISKFKKYVTILNPDYFFDMLVRNENDTFQIHMCQFLEANGSQYLTPMKIFVKVKNLSTTTKFVS